MKTSNKILFGLIGFISFICLCFLVYAKSQLIPKDQTGFDSNQIKASGVISSTKYEVIEFNAIEIGDHYEVFLSQGSNSVTIETDDNLLDYVAPKIEGNILKLTKKSSKGIQNFRGFKIFITAKNLETITAHDFAKVQIDSSFQAENLFLKLTESSEIRLNEVIIEKEIRIMASNFTKIKMSGSAEKMSLDAKGSAVIDALNFEAKEAILFSSDFVKAKINTKDRLEINATGSSEIAYIGEPRISQSIRDFVKINQIQ